MLKTWSMASAAAIFLALGPQVPPNGLDRAVDWPAQSGQSGSTSADGQWVCFVDRNTRELTVWNVQDKRARAITSISANGGQINRPLISPDGTLVAFSGQVPGTGPGLHVVSVASADVRPPRMLLPGANLVARDWSEDGTSLVVTTQSGSNFDIGVLTLADGRYRVLKSVAVLSDLRFVAISPDGTLVAYDAPSGGKTAWHRAVFVMPAAGGQEVVVLDTPNWNSVVGFSGDGGSLVVLSHRNWSNDLLAIPIANGRRAGEPRALKMGLQGFPRSLTKNGGVLCDRVVKPPPAALLSVSIDRDGRAAGPAVPLETHDPLGFHRDPRWSADGRSFMYITSSPVAASISIRSTATSSTRRIPLLENALRTFDWSPDGRRIVFRTAGGLSIVDADSGATTNIPRLSAEYFHPQFTKNGAAVTYFKEEGASPNLRRSYVQRHLDSSQESVAHADVSALWTPIRYPAGRSPDGRYLLAMVYQNELPSTLHVLDGATGEVREVFRVDQPAAFNHYGELKWLSDSRSVVGTVRNTAGNQELWWIPIDSRPAKRIEAGISTIAETAIAVHPDGRQVAFVAGMAVPWGAPLRLGPQTIGGTELRVLEGLLPARR